MNKPKLAVEATPSVQKCPIYLRLPFKGDNIADCFKKRLSTALQRTYSAAKPVIMYSSNRIPVPSVKLPLTQSAKSNIIYQFQCDQCLDTYLGRTERQLKLRVAEHIPIWVRKQITHPTQTQADMRSTQTQTQTQPQRTPQSSIGKHVLQTNHWSDPATAFRVLFTAPNKRLLQFMEAIAIKRLQPALCKQKELFVSLALPW